MDVSSINNLMHKSAYGVGSTSIKGAQRMAGFEELFDSAVGMFKNTNNYINSAEEAEIAYSLGFMNNTHELQVAQQKANVALQYTVAIRNGVLDAYKEIMALQF